MKINIITIAVTIFASFFSFVSCSENSNEISIMSFNTQHCMKRSGIIDYDEFANIIIKSGADFVCLQEIDYKNDRCNGDDQMKELSERCHMFPLFSKAINFAGGEYGVGMLSKSKPLNVTKVALPGKEARTSIFAEFNNVNVICTHLALQDSNRVKSAKIITEKALQLAQNNKPTFLCGDLNDENLESEMFQYLKEFWTIVSSDGATYPTPEAEIRIDYILKLKTSTPTNTKKQTSTNAQTPTKTKMQNSKVITEIEGSNVRQASDHFPIIYTSMSI